MRLRALPLVLMMYLLLAVLGTMSLAWNLIAVVLYPLLPRRTGEAVGRAGVSRVYRWFWALARLTGMLRLEASVLDRFCDEPGLIIAANHPSMLDAMMLVARLPRSTCIMKAELMGNPFLGAGARLARYICTDSTRGTIRQAVNRLKEGGQLIMFPEGTRTTRSPINPFRPGCTLIAKLANAPIQTVFIDTDSPYVGKGWPVWRLPPMPIVFSVRIGERFAPMADADAMHLALEAYFLANTKPGGAAGHGQAGQAASSAWPAPR